MGFVMIENIYVCSDFLATKEKEQFSNRRWLIDVLMRPILLSTGIKIQSFFSSLVGTDKFSRERFFSKSGVSFDKDATQIYFDERKITDDSCRYLSSFLSSRDLIIGYELSSQTRAVLRRIGVEYIDIWLHPVRFLDDILFAFNSSNKEVYDELKKFRVSEEVFYLYGNRLKVQAYKGYNRRELPIMSDSALFVGQTLNDKAICDKGKYLTVLDFKEKVLNLTKQYSCVYYSRHPYVKKGDERILKFINDTPKCELTTYSAYDLIASGKIKEVVSISSSVALEARYMGVKSTILFKPAIEIRDKVEDGYIAVLQSFLSPDFWETVLRPLCNVFKSPHVEYIDKRDKLRDMLAFYWSYKDVDKLEGVRQEVKQLKKNNISSIKKQLDKTGEQKNVSNADNESFGHIDYLRKIYRQIDKYDVISFDVFDTLVERPFSDPNDLFDFMELLNPRISRLSNFSDLRKKSRNLFTSAEQKNEISLEQRYKRLSDILGQNLLDIATCEEKTDWRLLRRRELGWRLYSYAKLKGKRIVFVSDTYYGEDYIKSLLTHLGYEIQDGLLFVSSKYGEMKNNGKLYPIVMKTLAIPSNAILHIGDNPVADGLRAKENNISSIVIDRSYDVFKKNSLLSSSLKKFGRVEMSIVEALISNRYYNLPFKNRNATFVGNDPEKFGYSILGVMFLSFAKWILEDAIQRKVERVYFLARDGEIVKRCYDCLACCYKGAPKSYYLLASRRGVNVPSLFSKEDIFNSLSVNFSPIKLKDLFFKRFGVRLTHQMIELNRELFASIDEVVKFPRDLEKLKEFASSIADKILANASEERALLLDYFEKQDLMKSGKIAFVDIGHQGSLQKSICALVGKAAHGYYFSTFKSIENFLKWPNTYSAFYQENISPKDKDNPYIKHILMFETVFLNTSTSFVKFEKIQGQKLKPVFLDANEQGRVKFIEGVHKGVVNFCNDWVEIWGNKVMYSSLDSKSVAQLYVDFLNNPTPEDVKLFQGVGFENEYSGRGLRYILSKDSGIWPEGCLLYREFTNSWQHLIANYVNRYTDQKKVRKFYKDPYKYFDDSKNIFFNFLKYFFR